MVLVRRGFGEFVELVGLPQSWFKSLASDVSHETTLWQRIRLTLEDLGPTFVKFGQVLATRPDLLPEPLVLELKGLRNQARPVPFEQLRPVLEAELGRPLEDVFSTFDTVPSASGSIGQVHRAHLRDNRQMVAVKIQRPGIRQAIRSDIEIIGWLARRLNEKITEFTPYDLPGIVEATGEGMMHELDFTIEANNAALFNHLNPFPKEVFAPQVFEAFTTERLTVTAWVDGLTPGDATIPASTARRVAAAGGRSVFHQIMLAGFFHADPHTGNLLVTPDGRACFLDWGMTGQLTREMRYFLADLFSAIAASDAEKVVRIADIMAQSKRRIDRTKLEKEVNFVLRRYGSRFEVGEEMGRVMIDLLYVFGSNGITLARDYSLLAKAILSIEEVAHCLDPAFDVRALAKPFLKKLAEERWSPANLARQSWWNLLNNFRRLRELPQDVQRFLRHLEDGEIRVNLRHEGLVEAGQELTSGVDRLVLAVITAALIIGSSFIMASTVDDQTSTAELFRLPTAFGTIGYLLSALFGVWTVINILRHGRQR